MFSINKEFTIDYAHRLLLPYDSLCNNLHGHTGKIVLSLTLPQLNDEGMLIDFNELKIFINKIKNKYDHSTLINEKDKDLLNFCQSHDYRYVTFNGNPTSENIAKKLAYNLYYEYNKLLKDKKWMINITFYETPTASAEYMLSSNDFEESKKEIINPFKSAIIRRSQSNQSPFKVKKSVKKEKTEKEDNINGRDAADFLYKMSDVKRKCKKEDDKKSSKSKKCPWDFDDVITQIFPKEHVNEIKAWINKLDFDDPEDLLKTIKNAPKFIKDFPHIKIKIHHNED